MKHTAAESPSTKKRTVKQRTVRRASRVQRGRVTLQPAVARARNFARWTPASPWDGRDLGSGLADTSQLACDCGECGGCQQRVG